MDHDEIVRLYGPWCSRTPCDVVELMHGYRGRWWIAGGWAVEAFTNIHRPHGDIDLSILRTDADQLRRHLRGRLDVWAADAGTLRPLVGDDAVVASTCGNLWLRASGAHPWEYDVIPMDESDGRWVYQRDARVTLPFTDILWRRDGVDYLRPEIQLLYKAPGLRALDQLDFDTCLPLLGDQSKSWLRTALQTAHPGHRWIDDLC